MTNKFKIDEGEIERYDSKPGKWEIVFGFIVLTGILVLFITASWLLQ